MLVVVCKEGRKVLCSCGGLGVESEVRDSVTQWKVVQKIFALMSSNRGQIAGHISVISQISEIFSRSTKKAAKKHRNVQPFAYKLRMML